MSCAVLVVYHLLSLQLSFLKKKWEETESSHQSNCLRLQDRKEGTGSDQSLGSPFLLPILVCLVLGTLWLYALQFWYCFLENMGLDYFLVSSLIFQEYQVSFWLGLHKNCWMNVKNEKEFLIPEHLPTFGRHRPGCILNKWNNWVPLSKESTKLVPQHMDWGPGIKDWVTV